MRKLYIPIIIIFCTLFSPVALNSTVVVEPVTTVQKKVNIKTPTPKEIEKAIGRKLTLKERLSLFILKTFKITENGNSGSTALIFGIIGAGLFIAGLFIPYVIIGSFAAALTAVIIGSVAKKSNPSDKKAHAATLLGWITLGAIALLLILAAIVLATWF